MFKGTVINKRESKIIEFSNTSKYPIGFSFDHFTLLLVQVEKKKRERDFDGNSARSGV